MNTLSRSLFLSTGLILIIMGSVFSLFSTILSNNIWISIIVLGFILMFGSGCGGEENTNET